MSKPQVEIISTMHVAGIEGMNEPSQNWDALLLAMSGRHGW